MPDSKAEATPFEPRALPRSHQLLRLRPMQRRIVVGESPDWTRRCLPRLEADSHPTEPRPPDPTTTVLIMLDIHPR